MSVNDLLSQDEIDALLHGVDSGTVDTDAGSAGPGEARQYDLGQPGPDRPRAHADPGDGQRTVCAAVADRACST